MGALGGDELPAEGAREACKAAAAQDCPNKLELRSQSRACHIAPPNLVPEGYRKGSFVLGNRVVGYQAAVRVGRRARKGHGGRRRGFRVGQQVAEGIGRCFAFFWHLCSGEVVLGLSIVLLQVMNTTRGGEHAAIFVKQRAKKSYFVLVVSNISLVTFGHIIHF